MIAQPQPIEIERPALPTKRDRTRIQPLLFQNNQPHGIQLNRSLRPLRPIDRHGNGCRRGNRAFEIRQSLRQMPARNPLQAELLEPKPREDDPAPIEPPGGGPAEPGIRKGELRSGLASL